jgi:hypothetical protein
VQKEAIQFMRGMMDEFTHLKNFSRPIDPELIIVIAARLDMTNCTLGMKCS